MFTIFQTLHYDGRTMHLQ